MLKKNFNKILLSGALSVGILSSLATNAFAAQFGSELWIDAKATTVNVTVPSNAPMIFNEDGTNTLPTNFTVTNNSKIAGVSLTGISLDSKNSGWTLLSEGTDLKVQAKDLKKIKLKMGKDGQMKTIAPTNGSNDSTGSASWSSGDISIPALGSETIKFEVDRGAFDTPVANAKAFDMTLNFEFN